MRARSSTAPDEGHGGSALRLRVNRESVGTAELWRRVRDELSRSGESLSREAYQQFVARKAAQLITDKIAEMLLFQEASARLTSEMDAGVTRYIDGEIRKIINSKYGGSKHAYKKNLESKGETLSDARNRLRRELTISSYLETELKRKVTEPTRAELFALYQANADGWRRPERRSMSLIEVSTRARLANADKDPTSGEREEARAEARERIDKALDELGSGSSFADAAERYSDGLRASDGGAWGWVQPGSVRERFEPVVAALYDLDAGEVSELIEADGSYFLVRCDEVDPGLEPSFATVQPELNERYFRSTYSGLIERKVQALRLRATIEPADLGRFHAALVAAAPAFRPATAP